MASTSDQFFYLDSPPQFEEWVDFDQFLDLPSAYGDEYSASASTNSVSPDMALPYDAEMLGTDLLDFRQSTLPDMIDYDASQEGFFADLSPEMGMIPDHLAALDDSACYTYPQYDASFDFRPMVEAQAAADPRIASIKEKRREAAIALHLQRLCDATARDLDMSSDSNTSFSSPSWSEYVRGSSSPQSASASPGTPSAPTPAAGTGGVELVLDLNMNAAANLPKKQKPRSQAQKENYIKARKYGACEKHKKQHKRCNCLEKAAARMGVQDVPMNVAYKERPQQSAHSSLVLPDSRVSSVPGHDKPSVSPTTRPLPTVSTGKKLKVTINNSPGHDPSTSSSGVLPSVRATMKRTSGVPGHNPQFRVSAFAIAKQAGKTVTVQPDQAVDAKRSGNGVRGHDPQYSASAYLTHVKEAGKNIVSGQNVPRQATSVTQPVRATNSRGVAQSNLRSAAAARLSAVKTADKATGSLGQGVSRQSPSGPQSVNATNQQAIGQSNLRWRIVGFSPTTNAGVSSSVQENSNTRQTASTSSTSNSSTSRCQDLDVRRPRDKMLSLMVDNRVSPTTPVSSRAQSSSILANFGQESVSRGGLAANNSPRSMAGFQKPLDILTTRARAQVEMSPQDRCPNISFGQNSLVVPPISAQLGGLFSSTVSAIAGIGLSSVSFAAWSEQSIGKCISILGSQLMSARKLLQSSLI